MYKNVHCENMHNDIFALKSEVANQFVYAHGYMCVYVYVCTNSLHNLYEQDLASLKGVTLHFI